MASLKIGVKDSGLVGVLSLMTTCLVTIPDAEPRDE